MSHDHHEGHHDGNHEGHHDGNHAGQQHDEYQNQPPADDDEHKPEASEGDQPAHDQHENGAGNNGNGEEPPASHDASVVETSLKSEEETFRDTAETFSPAVAEGSPSNTTDIAPSTNPQPVKDGAGGVISHGPDDLATMDLIEQLKAQLMAVTDQRDLLNSKLVTSFSRVADLEDDLDHLRDNERENRVKIDILEHEREEHLYALDTGLLVEKSNVKAEMQRLAASLVDEQSKRDVAEEGRRTVENEVDDLAANLFQQANSMVATERLARSRVETRLSTAEESLAMAESVVREMQKTMQELQHAAATSVATASDQRLSEQMGSAARKLRSDHTPYSEFLLFVSHVRTLRPLGASSDQIPPPTLLSLLSHPFISRLVTEDHDPALRLDFAPGVTFFSKKSVSQAIIDGMLIVEPVTASQVAAQKADGEVICALSGKVIIPASPVAGSSYDLNALSTQMIGGAASGPLSPAPPPPPPARGITSGASRFFSRNTSRPVSPSTSTTPTLPPLPPRSTSPTPKTTRPQAPVYVFRIAPSPSQVGSDKAPHLYPVAQGWPLARLRATCELWRFVKTGILAPIWVYEDGTRPLPPPATDGVTLSAGGIAGRPALPPRKSSKGWGISGWGLGIGGAKVAGESQAVSPVATRTIAAPPLPARKGPPKLPARRLPPPLEKTEVELAQSVETAMTADAATVAEPAPFVAAGDSEVTLVVETDMLASDSPATEERSSSPVPAATTEGNIIEPAQTSSASVHSSNTSEGFKTPQGEDMPLPPVTENSTGDEAAPPVAVMEEEASSADGKEEFSSDAPPTSQENGSAPAPEDASPPVLEDGSSATPPESNDSASPSPPLPEAASPADTSADASADPTTRTSLDNNTASTPNASTPNSTGPPPIPRRAPARRAVPALPGSAPVSTSAAPSAPVSAPSSEPTSRPSSPVAADGDSIREAKEGESPEALANGEGGEETVVADAGIVELSDEKQSSSPAGEEEEEEVNEPEKKEEEEEANEPEKKEEEEEANEPKEKEEEEEANGPEKKEKEEEWESKVWRELARLREELFWKRIGVEEEE